ncbi:hypothetical protein PR002_g31030, partial [Phytophthora rubi]
AAFVSVPACALTSTGFLRSAQWVSDYESTEFFTYRWFFVLPTRAVCVPDVGVEVRGDRADQVRRVHDPHVALHAVSDERARLQLGGRRLVYQEMCDHMKITSIHKKR